MRKETEKRGREQNEEKKGREKRWTVRVEGRQWEKRGKHRVRRDGECRMREEREMSETRSERRERH